MAKWRGTRHGFIYLSAVKYRLGSRGYHNFE